MADEYLTNYAGLSVESSNNTSYLAYFASAGTAAVSCSATVTLPDGTTPTVSASASVSVVSPTDGSRFDTGVGSVIIGNSVLGTFSIATTPAAGKDNAIQWIGNLSLAAPFTGQGTWTFAQVIDNQRYYQPFNGSETPEGTGTNVPGCDTSFPYISGSHPADGSDYINGDSPAYALDMSAATQNQYVRKETFQTWIIYLPPNSAAGNSMYVPIHTFNWSWQGAATYTRANTVGLPVGWQALATPNLEIDLGADAPTTQFPYWDCCITTGGILETGS